MRAKLLITSYTKKKRFLIFLFRKEKSDTKEREKRIIFLKSLKIAINRIFIT